MAVARQFFPPIYTIWRSKWLIATVLPANLYNMAIEMADCDNSSRQFSLINNSSKIKAILKELMHISIADEIGMKSEELTAETFLLTIINNDGTLQNVIQIIFEYLMNNGNGKIPDNQLDELDRIIGFN
ncbi:hypothetical protein PV327_010854 [Microctonus hyperodae]|uniref:Uncharacterized protein n=1 Tax=Microctonus hyperodae TaxID=165561 RepID=A0AA39F1F4_MICHY|nr:hypothetical protein PV327_010854 [Microctonus hyperodae]